MQELAPDVYLLNGFPAHAVNIYLIGDVLIDAGTRYAAGGTLRQLQGRTLSAHALTHVHPDHQGASAMICQRFNIPLWVGADDADVMESGDWKRNTPSHPLGAVMNTLFAGAAHPVARRLREGDEVADFKVIETPGHTPGHISFWRERDAVLIVGDVVANMNIQNGTPGLAELPPSFAVDLAQNRASARKLAALEPRIMCFGHGAPFYHEAKFAVFVQRLPD